MYVFYSNMLYHNSKVLIAILFLLADCIFEYEQKFTGLHVNSARHWLTEVHTVRILAIRIPNKT